MNCLTQFATGVKLHWRLEEIRLVPTQPQLHFELNSGINFKPNVGCVQNRFSKQKQITGNQSVESQSAEKNRAKRFVAAVIAINFHRKENFYS